MTTTHKPCDSCGSSDALAIYESGTHCFSCGKHVFNDEQPNNFSVKTPAELIDHQECFAAMALPKRRISQETCKKYNYLVGYHKGTFVHVANHYDSERNICAQKLRYPDKTFPWRGEPKNATLFGQHLFTPNANLSITITEGAIDALSIAEIYDCKWPVVSLKGGAQSAKKELEEQFEYLNGFKEIRLCFDNDEVGLQAVEDCTSIPFEAGKLKIVSLPMKDASDMLQAGRVRDLQSALSTPKVYRPDCVVNSKEINWDEVLLPVSKGWTMPYPMLEYLINGILPRRLYMISAGFGCGKTTFMKELAYHLRVHHDLKIASIHLEEGFQETVLSYICMDNNIAINTITDDPSKIGSAKIEKSKEKLYAEGKMTFYKHFGSDNVDNLLKRLDYFASAERVDIILLDHVTAAVSGISGKDDDRKTIDRLLDGLRSMVQRTGVTVIAAVQLVKTQGKTGPNDGGQISLADLRGSGQIAGTSDICIALEGDQQGENPNERKIRVLKNRISGKVGIADTLNYDECTGRLLPIGSIMLKRGDKRLTGGDELCI